jgi:hypothetical protein
VAVSVTKVPLAKSAEHIEPPEPQLIPEGLDVIVPFVGVGLMENV